MKNKTVDRDGFLAAFAAATTELDKPFKREFNGAVIELTDAPQMAMKLNSREIYLQNLEASQLRRGQGTRAVQFLTSLADQFGVDIVAHATPNTNAPAGSPGDYKLAQFYHRFGFTGGGERRSWIVFRPAADEPVATP